MLAARSIGRAHLVGHDEGGMVAVRLPFETPRLNPYAFSSNKLYSLFGQTFGMLGRYDYLVKAYAGVLAERWVLVDHLTWRFTLRTGLVRHDGGPGPTSRDVVHSWRRALTDPASAQAFVFAEVQEIRPVDNRTFDIVTNRPLGAARVHGRADPDASGRARARGAMPAPAVAALLEVRGITRTFVRSRGLLAPPSRRVALRGVDMDLRRGEILGIVGESGCGKSTLARIIVGLERADAGSIVLGGRTLVGSSPAISVPAARRGIQMVFQDPYASLNPRLLMQDIVDEGLAIAGRPRPERVDRAARALASVGLQAADAGRYVHQFSGGQRQRISIARALVMEPAVLVADEAVSALDVSVQMQVLNLLLTIREAMGISIVFITHDIGVVQYLCDRVVVMSEGSVVESGKTATVVGSPQHPFTRRLIAAMP